MAKIESDWMYYRTTWNGQNVSFRKYRSENTGTVNMFIDGKEVDMFTDYGIKTDQTKLRNSCKEWLKYLDSQFK